MYLVAGSVTLLWGIILWFIFPMAPQDARGFTADERALLLERVRGNDSGSENRRFRWYQVQEAVSSYHLWCIFLLSVLSSVGSGRLLRLAPLSSMAWASPRLYPCCLTSPSAPSHLFVC